MLRGVADMGILSAGSAVFKMEKGRLKRCLARALRFQTAFCLFGLDFFPMRAAYFLLFGGAGRQDGMLFGAVLVVAHVAGVSAVFVADGGAGRVFLAQGSLALAVFIGFPRAAGQYGHDGKEGEVAHFVFLSGKTLF